MPRTHPPHRLPPLSRLAVVLALVGSALLASALAGGAPAASAAASSWPAPPDPVGVWPLQPHPEVVRRFDPPDVVYGAGHRGVDLAGRPGQLVHAALPGRVAYAGRIAGRGVVVVSHGPTRTTYEPVASTLSPGSDLPAGAVLGRLELAGSHCLPRACLHWGWIAGETYLDPLRLVGGVSVRLLPLGGLSAARAAGGWPAPRVPLSAGPLPPPAVPGPSQADRRAPGWARGVGLPLAHDLRLGPSARGG
jgi:murein DD-endopeptidase MepM/ murein hydrolase activator NlpD